MCIRDRAKDDRNPPYSVGHNILGFDAPYIWRRAIANGIRPPAFFEPPVELKAWSKGIGDTMIMWSGVRDRVSLDTLCKVFGIPGKDGIDGSMVWDMYQNGRLEEISEYCVEDVEKTSEVYKRMV